MLDKTLQELQERNVELEGSVRRLREELQQAQARADRVSDVNLDLARTTGRCEQLETENARLRIELACSEELVSKLRHESGDRVAGLQQAAAKMAELQLAFEERTELLNTRLAHAQGELSSAHQTIANLEEQLQAAHTDKIQRQQEFDRECQQLAAALEAAIAGPVHEAATQQLAQDQEDEFVDFDAEPEPAAASASAAAAAAFATGGLAAVAANSRDSQDGDGGEPECFPTAAEMGVGVGVTTPPFASADHHADDDDEEPECFPSCPTFSELQQVVVATDERPVLAYDSNLQALLDLGFGVEQSRQALQQHGSVEAAAEALLSTPTTPIVTPEAARAAAEEDAHEQRVVALMAMGFEHADCVRAIALHGEDITAAADWLGGLVAERSAEQASRRLAVGLAEQDAAAAAAAVAEPVDPMADELAVLWALQQEEKEFERMRTKELLRESADLATALAIQEEEEQEQLARAVPAEFDCEMCLDTVPMENRFVLRNCMHEFCRPCVFRYLQSLLEQGTFPNLCPTVGCGVRIDREDVELSGFPLRDMRRWDEIALRAGLESDAQWR